MRPTSEIRALLKHAGIRTSASRDQSVLADALRAGGLNRDNRSTRPEPSLWRTIMKSRTTKFVTAAVIVAAVIISLSQFNQPVVKAVELSDMTQAMQQVPWMHYSGSMQTKTVTGKAETWMGFDAKVQGAAMPDGKVTFWRYKEHERAEYDPNTKAITLTYLPEDDSAPPMSSPVQMLESTSKLLKDRGAEIVTKTGAYRGRKVQVQEMSFSVPESGIPHWATTLYIDPQSKLLLGYGATAKDANGVVVSRAECTCDYPQTGPRDIYDLGVPRDARIVDKTPTPDFSKVWEEYKRRRAEAVEEYAAIIVNANDDGIVGWLDVDYKSGSNSRHESHYVFLQDEPRSQLWPQYREQLGNTFESMLAWTRQRYEDPRSGRLQIELNSGKNSYTIVRSENGTWGELAKHATNGSGASFLGSCAWPPIVLPTARIIEDDYSRQNELICVEELNQGEVVGSYPPVLPRRVLHYLDPAHDYLCYRLVTEQRPDAVWQENKNWLAGVDLDKVPGGSIEMQEITAVVQAKNGHWYPRTIVTRWIGLAKNGKTPPSTQGVCTVHLQIPPMLPEGIFEVDGLPSSGSGSAKEGHGISFEQAKNETLAAIRQRQVWPKSPESVSKAFWAARAQKDYAEMQMLWPGSASFNWPQICQNDPNVEYVFGESRADGTEVPYAAKDYFEKNHKHNLTMRLKKLDTDKGPRYYIVSGN